MKLKKDFHPRLYGFAGFSGSGKTTLIEKIIKEMSCFHIGYLKHDAHKFELDRPGKDTYRQYEAGAKVVFINDPEHFALQVRGKSYTLEKEYFKDCDMVLVEGHKYSDHPKFLFLDKEGAALAEYREGKIKNVMATISIADDLILIDDLPAFHRDDLQGIISLLKSMTNASVEKVELHGLVLAGGKSTRMGNDKSLINYHGRPHALYILELLKDLGIKSFLSCREDQLNRPGFEGTPTITDRFIDFGPLGGVLSAMATFPQAAWLVIACDLPLVNAEKIRELIDARDPLKQATAYFTVDRDLYEPLFAIYEPSIYSRMLHFLGNGQKCPQKALFNSNIKQLVLQTQGVLQNANTSEEKVRALEILGRNV